MPWQCNWCPQTKGKQKRGPDGPKTLCRTCNQRWGRGEKGPRSADWSCGWCGVQETTRRYKGPNGPGELCESCAGRHKKGATGPLAEDWRCDWCGTCETRWRHSGPKGRETLCDGCGWRFTNGKTGPRSAEFECRWCKTTSTHYRRAGPTGEDELCDSCGRSYARASDKITARLDHVEKELARLTSENERLTSVPVIDAETGAELRERPPKRTRDNEDTICVGAVVEAKSQVWGAGFVRRVGAARRYRGRVVARGNGDIFPVGCPPPATGEHIWRVLYDDDGEEYDTPERFLFVAPTSGLKALKTATDATASALAEVKSENSALEGQRDRNDATAAAASAAAATANAAAATANDDAEEAQDTLGYQVRFTDALQTKIDELHALARQVDPVAADAIKNRQAT